MIKYLITFLTITFLLTGCGSTNETTDTSINDPVTPIQKEAPKSAHGIFTAGDDQTILKGSNALLSISILDPDKEFNEQVWKIGDEVLSRESEFEVDLPEGEHEVILEAIDSEGNVYSDTIVIIVKKEDEKNTPPSAENISFTTDEDTQIKTALLGSDSDGDALSYLFVSYPKHGRLSGSAANLRYTPDTNYYGSDSFRYKTNDGVIDSEYATVNITVNSINDIPTATAQTITLSENSSKNITLLGTDADGDDLTFTYTTPSHGIFDGTTYTPVGDYSGNDSFTFIVNDGKLDSLPATISIMITPVNDAPEFTNDAININTHEDNSTIEGIFTAVDSDGDDYYFTTESNLTGFTLNLDGTFDLNLSSAFYQALQVDENISKTILVRVVDEAGVSDEQNLTIMIAGINDAMIIDPITIQDSNLSDTNGTITGTIIANDADDDVTFTDTNTTNGFTIHETTGVYSFTPPSGTYDYLAVGESTTITIPIMINDEVRDITITIIGVNTPPSVVIGDDYNITVGNVLNIGISSIDDVDGSIIQYSWHVDTVEESISDALDYTFTHEGSYTVMLTVTDDKNATATDSLTVTVNPVPIEEITFTPTLISAAADAIVWLEMADLDKDGDLDILATSQSELFWYENRGGDNYIKNSIADTDVQAIHAADINDDGYIDILYAEDFLQPCINNQDKTFTCDNADQLYKTTIMMMTPADDITSISVSDIDGENGADIIVTSRSNDRVEAYLQKSDGTFDSSSYTEVGSGMTDAISVDSTDFDGDGDFDIVAVASSGIRYYTNDGTGDFTEEDISNSANAMSVSNADMNNFAHTDIISTYATEIRWSAIALSDMFKGTIDDDIINPPFASGVDMNGDKYTDVISNSYEENGKIVWYESKSSKSFDKHIIDGDASYITITQAGDIDSDGNMDVVAGDVAGNIIIYKNDTAVTPVQTPPITAGDFTRDNENDTVTDNSTGLIWKDDDTVSIEIKTWDEAQSYCSVGWRLPTMTELNSISDKGRSDPSINSVFSNNNATVFWTSVPSQSDNTLAWGIDFNASNDKPDLVKLDSYHVRCVKGSSIEATLIRDDSQEVVLDKQHKLMWQDDVNVTATSRTWDDSIDYCNNLNSSGYTNWRLPNFNELTTITDRYKPFAEIAIKDAFIVKSLDVFWSSTSVVYDSSKAFAIKFSEGSDKRKLKDENHYVRCVRDF